MTGLQANVAGEVTYAEGDGSTMTIPRGPCEISLNPSDATISWRDGDSAGATAVPLDNYQRHLDAGAIVLSGSKPPDGAAPSP